MTAQENRLTHATTMAIEWTRTRCLAVPWRRTALTLIWLALSASASRAEINLIANSVHPASRPGYNPQNVFVKIDGADINAFNFNFVTQFPLAVGFEYPENAGLSLDLKLVYNSKFWNREWENCQRDKKFRIRRQNPFGLGWDLHFGRIVKVPSRQVCAGPVGLAVEGRMVYVAPTGERHSLIHEGPDAEGEVYTTVDGSHIRFVKRPDPAGWRVYFTSGEVQDMDHFVSGPAFPDLVDPSLACCVHVEGHEWECPGTPSAFVPDDPSWQGYDRDYVGWHTTSVRSTFADEAEPPSYSITYYPDPFSHVIQRVHDQHGRTIDVILDTTTGPMRGQVTSIRVPAPQHPDTGAARVAEYELQYQQFHLLVANHDHSVKVLTAFKAPIIDGSHRYIHEFTYNAPGEVVAPRYLDLGGLLKEVRYPSGKLTRISYREYPFRTSLESSPLQSPDTFNESPMVGVSELRSFLDGNPANGLPENVRLTTLSQATIVDRGPGCVPNCYGKDFYDQLHTMVDPAGNRTEFRFRSPEPDYFDIYDNFIGQEHGRVEWEKYYGGADLKKRVDYTYVQRGSSDCALDYNWVKETITTMYSDDRNADGSALGDLTTMLESRSQFDDFDQAQRIVYSGNAIGTESKVEVKDYAADNEDGAGAACFPEIRRKNLGSVLAREEARTTDGTTESVLSRNDYSFDASSGRVTKAIQRAVPSGPTYACSATPPPANDDIVTENDYNELGDVNFQRRFIQGGDGEVGRVFGWVLDYSYGVLSSVKNDVLPYFDTVRTIDSGSGLVVEDRQKPTSATSGDGVLARVGYDVLGRQVRVSVGDDAPTEWSFVHDVTGEKATLRRVITTQGSGEAQTQSVDWFEKGKRVREDVLRPDGSWSYRHTRYDNADRVAFVSEWTTASNPASPPGTITDYTFVDSTSAPYEDPFGRPSQTTGPLGEVTRFAYFGTNTSTTTVGVAGGAATEAPFDATTVTYKDALDRLRVVDSPKRGTTVEGADAVYSYDVEGNLVGVNLVSNVTLAPSQANRYATTNSPDQVRTFVYDSLGRQRSATLPENGTTQTLLWNALGSPTEVQDSKGAAWKHKTRTTYDVAGRPTRVERVLDGTATQYESVLTPGSTGWNATGWSLANSATCLGRTAWYHGSSSCQYAQGIAQTATLESPAIANVPVGATLSFEFTREVRAGPEAGGSRDRFHVEAQGMITCPLTGGRHDPSRCDTATGECPPIDPVETCVASWGEPIVIYESDSTQVSFGRWAQSPEIPLFSGTIRLRFIFDSISPNTNGTLHGIGIGPVAIRRPQSVPLVEMGYDEPYGITGNKARGQLTSVTVFDEVGLSSTLERRFEYVQNEGKLSKEHFLKLDWDRSGNNRQLNATYEYDEFGRVTGRTLPHPSTETARAYRYGYRHGALVHLDSILDGVVQELIPDGFEGPGVEYNPAGSPTLYRFANDTRQHFAYNAANLPDSIWAEVGAESTPVFESGLYRYDGARNIKSIGADLIRYDAAGRLDWARVASITHGSLDLDYQYDKFGNMTARTTTRTNEAVETPLGPDSLHFTGRSYSNNRIAGPTFLYDQGGNLVSEAVHNGVGGYLYGFSRENRMTHIRSDDGDRGRFQLEAAYDDQGHRWLRRLWSEGSKATITLRDATGKVTAEFAEESASSGFKHVKDYIYAGSQLIAVNSYCGPRPDLVLDTPSRADGNVKLVRTDNVPSEDGFTILIQTAGGQRKVLHRPSTLATHFEIAESEMFPYETNLVSIQTLAACGATGHSNAVSYAYVPPQEPPPTCLTTLGASRIGGAGGAAGSISLQSTHQCPTGTTYLVYYWRLGDDSWGPLSPQPITNPNKMLSNQPAGTGYGRYWLSPVISGQVSFASGPAVDLGPPSEDPDSGTGGGSSTAPPVVNAQFFYWDHLGSTRAITDEKGVVIGKWKYYPFGDEAESTGGGDNRMLFTGHERDSGFGLDYMLARYYSDATARFASVDPLQGEPLRPQSWNRYAYVSNNPVGRVDPDGMEDTRTGDEQAMMNDPDVALAMGQASLGADGGNEWGFAAVLSNADYTTTPVVEGGRTSVNVPNPPGAAGRFHTHRHQTVRNADGTTSYTDPDKPGPADEANAQSGGTKGYILAPSGLIRVVGPGNSQFIMKGKEWRALNRYIRRMARAEKKAQQAAQKPAKKEEPKKKKKKDAK